MGGSEGRRELQIKRVTEPWRKNRITIEFALNSANRSITIERKNWKKLEESGIKTRIMKNDR